MATASHGAKRMDVGSFNEMTFFGWSASSLKATENSPCVIGGKETSGLSQLRQVKDPKAGHLARKSANQEGHRTASLLDVLVSPGFDIPIP